MQQKLTKKEIESEQQEHLYFAYGSNMNCQRMLERGAQYIKREAAQLPGYAFVMNKLIKSNGTAAANIIEDSNSSVHGVLYTCLGEAVFEHLDRFEGVKADQYHRKQVTVYLSGEVAKNAHVYIAHENVCRENLKINPQYFNHILKGEDLLPSEYINFLNSFQHLFISNLDADL